MAARAGAVATPFTQTASQPPTTYDNLNRLTRLKANKGATAITDFQYLYDAAGSRTRKQQLDYTEDYEYDPLYRLTAVTRSAGLTGLWQYGYDPVGNRLHEQKDSSVTTYTYNQRNQLLSTTGGGPVRWRGTLSEPGSVVFTSALVNGQPARMLAGNIFEADLQMQPGSNTVTVQATDVNGNIATRQYQVSVAGTGATYMYDANGNLETKIEGPDVWAYEWSAEKQLKRVLKNGVEQERFAYDPIGRRVEKVSGGTTTNFVYDEEDILREILGGISSTLVHGPWIDEPLAKETAATLTLLHADGLGTISSHTNTAGALSQAIRYDVWGNIEAGSASLYGFTARENDSAIAAAYHRARYYDPAIGRFITEDPIFEQGPNLYAYVENDPANWIDSSGEAKGGKQNIQVNHMGQTLTKKTPLQEIERCIKEAIEKAMSPKHIKKLEGLRKVVKRGGAMAIVMDPVLIDGTLLDLDRIRRAQSCEGGRCGSSPKSVISPREGHRSRARWR